MKIKVLERDPGNFLKARPQELQPVFHNPDPQIHPFERPREYVRALNAVKLGRIFAKPFVRSLAGHIDSVYSIAKHPSKLSLIVSGSANGELRLWNIATGDCITAISKAHTGFVRGTIINDKGKIFTCGDDNSIKLWDTKLASWSPQAFSQISDDEEVGDIDQLLSEFRNDLIKDEKSKNGDNSWSFHDPQSDPQSTSTKKYTSSTNTRYDDAYLIQDTPDLRRLGTPLYQPEVILSSSAKPLVTWLNDAPFTSISHQWSQGRVTSTIFATTSNQCLQIWDYHRSQSVSDLRWSDTDPDTFLHCIFNPIESDIIAATASDRSLALFDLRSKTPIRRLVTSMNNNGLAWNPMEAFHFTTANENHNLYTYDMRRLDIALNVHMDHVAAVLDVDYSPTGREFVSGSYDRTIRIFSVNQGHSREVYHTKRMQRVFCVRFSGDSKFVLSGSDDGNVRVWKSDASESVSILTSREKQKLNYQQKLIERYKHLPEISRIHRKRHVPSMVKYVQKTKRIIKNSQNRKTQSRIICKEIDPQDLKPERKKNIIKEDE